jgi:lipoprotein-anchoring transpeptidase ErfK/SrfK
MLAGVPPRCPGGVAARWLTAIACGLLVASVGLGASAPSASAGGVVISPTQELVVLLAGHRVYATPSDSARSIVSVSASRPITGEETVLPVTGRLTMADGVNWLHVMLPGRPNGSEGWMTERETRLTATVWHLVVATALRRVLAYRSGRLVATFAAIVGKPATPTPRGEFFVEESVQMLPGSAGAPFALALSARSDVLQDFEGGPGQIAIHGVAGLTGRLGTAASHGCVRISAPAVTWLAGRIGPGVPVTVT